MIRTDIAQAIKAELDHLLPAGWNIVELTDRFLVTPKDANSKPTDQALYAEAWRIAQFVAYRDFISISRRKAGGFTDRKSRTADGSAFLIEIAISR